MEVNRSDPKWLDIYKTNNKYETEEMKLKITDSIWRSYKNMEKFREEKKKKSIKVIDFIPETKSFSSSGMSASRTKKCQSLTMSGKPCPYRATSECGRFCKKHIL